MQLTIEFTFAKEQASTIQALEPVAIAPSSASAELIDARFNVDTDDPRLLSLVTELHRLSGYAQPERAAIIYYQQLLGGA
jgi:hypothetical protein